MSLAEGVQARIAYKAYATGVITSNTQPTSSSDPGASGAQVLRRVSSSLNLVKDTYRSNEVRDDRQIVDFRHGTKRVTGSITGEFSPATYWDFFEAACRGTAASAVSASQSDFTSAAADNTTSKFTFAGGDPVTKGYRVGDIIRFTGLSDTDNNTKNFLILSFGGASNRDVTVYPAPDTMSADTSFTVATVGQTLSVPSSSFVSRKFGIEEYAADIDVARLFTECRIGGFTLTLPATGLATVEFPVMGRDMEIYEASNAPFFTSPTAATSTGILAAVNGLIRVNGATVGVVTGQTIQMNLNPSSDPVVGQDFVPEIFLGSADVSGQLTAMFEDADLINNFVDEDEIEVLTYLTATGAVNSPAVSIYLPRVKLGGANLALQGMGSQILTLPFQALKYVGSGAGIETTTIRLADTQAS